jgi:hypothetical protein
MNEPTIPQNNTSSQGSITTKTIGDLCDGRLFYVPSYQRGYRWTSSQVEALLNDLWEFTQKQTAVDGEFYCLQPVIVQQRIKQYEDSSEPQAVESPTCYELVDGQQRLTTLYILLKYLLDAEQEYTHELYKLEYESRKDFGDFLQKITEEKDANNIDADHALKAYNTIKNWCENSEHNGAEDKLRDLLLPANGEKGKSVRVIWYEVDENTDLVREFLSINNGKISLTEAELIKALFLKQGSSSTSVDIDYRALEWERIENALQRPDFWHFLSAEIEEGHRMEVLLRLSAGEVSNETNALFNHYVKEFEEGKTAEDLWSKVIDTFHQLEDWYADPVKYNYIGVLTHMNVNLSEINSQYRGANNQDRFVELLKNLIKKKIGNINDISSLSYDKHKKQIRNLLLLLNVEFLTKQLQNLRKESNSMFSINESIYKFPFAIYVGEKWDIEHIDSATSINLLEAKDEIKREWIKNCWQWLGEDNHDTKSIKELDLNEQTTAQLNELINKIWKNCEETHSDANDEEEQAKNSIYNLTLLNAEINRGYGNAVFPYKRKCVLEAISKGKYILPCTQLVFTQNFNADIKIAETLKWTKESRESYSSFIEKTLESFLKNEDTPPIPTNKRQQ